MNKPNFIFKVANVFALCLLFTMASLAQPDARMQAEPSYEVVLQVVAGSNDAAQKNNLPQNLAAVAKNLRNNFSFANYRLSNTYIGRVANTGNLEYKTVASGFGQSPNAETPSFLEWSLGNLRNLPDPNGRRSIQLQPFRFGARMPIVTGSYKDDGGKMNSVINYESIGISLQRVSLPENAPTLVGTLSTPKADETIFLVLTVRPVEQ